MIKVEPIQNFDGFGNGQSPTEYYYSQGMARTQFGLTPNWSMLDEVTAGNGTNQVPNLALVNWFAANASSVFALDKYGVVYNANPITLNWANAYTPFASSHGNGMISDQTGRVLIAGDRYLSKWDGSTAVVTAGTVWCQNTNVNVAGTNTSFTSAMVGKQMVISGQLYTIASVSSTTSLALNSGFSGSNGTYNYIIYMGSTEQWKDFGSGFTTSGLRQMDIYEDWVVIANQNAIALLNTTDDSFTNQGMALPSNYNVSTLRAGQSGILVGVNVNARGAIFLWDAYSNGSISEWIWFNANILAIIPTNEGYLGYYVITSRGIYQTNGYVVTPIYQQMPDDRVNYSYIISNLTPNSVTLVGKYLMFFGGSGFARHGKGLYIFNTETKCFEFCPVSNLVQYDIGIGGIFFDSNLNIHLSYSTSKPSTVAISRLFNSAPASAYYITEPKGLGDGKTSFASNEKTADAAKFTITENPRNYSPANNTYTLALKVYNFQRSLWSFASTVAGTASPTQMTINGSIFSGIPVAQIGDEVTILQGVNAGQVAHITAIANQGTSAETWTLDHSLPNTTETSITLSLSPFKLVETFTFTNAAQLRDVYFDIKSKYKGKRFLLKLLFTNIINTELDITDGQFIYSDQGLITS